ncbi:hypothetical protein CSB37_01120 [bacterium DOLZORAL124_38_8]|nr:MAG: hypothetical protein CSB37_01120 [bacterium DOLZORAL124_38_8]
MKQTCPVSGKEFIVTQFEQDFLKKIAPTFAGKTFEIPLPKLCPEERMRLRTLHRNEQFLYRNVSAFSQQNVISIYPTDTDFTIVSKDEWFSDTWDGLDYGTDFDFSKNFFEQFQVLRKKVPRASTVNEQNENCEYTTGTAYSKNCYLINSSENCEDCYYSKLLQQCTNVVDSAYCYDSELLYECFNVKNCYDCKYTYNAQNSSDCWFCDDIKNCQNCFLSTNLVGQQYVFMNQKLSKDEYEKRIQTILNSKEHWEKCFSLFKDVQKNRWYKYAQILNSENCTGDFIANSQNCLNCYDVTKSQDCLNVQVGVEVKDLLDCSNMYLKPELSYSVLGTINTYNVHFCLYVFNSNNVFYSELCYNCQNCFGCVGLRNNKYCIFNKQYSPEEYENTVTKIIEHMQTTGEWGQFFPAWMSTFPYNKSLAYEYLPLTKEEAIARNYQWESPKTKSFLPQNYAIPNRIEDTPDDICTKILACEVSGENYRIQPAELRFYRTMNLPIPKKCPNTRYQERMKMRNERKLYQRKCVKSGEAIATTFAPNRPEKILCEKEYQKIIHG